MNTALTEAQLLSSVRLYKRSVASRYRSITGEDLGELVADKYWVSPKIDGQLWFVYVHARKVTVLSHSGRRLPEDAALHTALVEGVATRTDHALIAGELFAAPTGKRARVGEVAHALGEEGDLSRLGFQAFDLLDCGNDAAPLDYGERLALLNAYFKDGKRTRAIKTFEVNHEALPALYGDYVDSGTAEGLVARASDGRVYKVKPRFSVDCTVLGFTVKRTEVNQVRSILLGLERPDGSMQVVGACGNLGSDKARETLHQLLAPTVVESALRRVCSSGALYRLCAPSVVVEIETSDVQSEDASGAAIQQWVLRLDETEDWVPMGKACGASLLHPSLARLRDDKTTSGVDIRLEQVNERCFAAHVDTPVVAVTLPKSEVIKRLVYTKATKGSLAVRKVVLWRTNKREFDARYPNFVVHYTDYSPGRAAPIKRQVRLAPTQEIAEQIAASILSANIKKGWAVVE